MRRVLTLSTALAALLSPLPAGKFSIVIIPDTQKAVEAFPERVDEMARYIVRMKDSLKIAYVLHMGDLVEHGGNRAEWTRFSASMKILDDAGVPYLLNVGNHDFDLRGAGTANYNEFFPVSRTRAVLGKTSHVTWGGSYPEGKNTNSYHLFQAGGLDWLALSIKFNPTPDELQWAGTVAASHPQRKIIVVTHSYLNPGGGSLTTDGGIRTWEGFVKKHPNILKVYSGHLVTAHSTAVGDNGNTVYQLCYDFQGDYGGNNAILGIVTMDPEGRKMIFRSHDAQKDTMVTRTTWTNEPMNVFEYAKVEAIAPKPSFIRRGGAPFSRALPAGTDETVRVFNLKGERIGEYPARSVLAQLDARAGGAGRAGKGEGVYLLRTETGGLHKYFVP